MKSFKKIASVFLALALCLCMAVPAFAATTNENDTGSITINGLNGGVTVSAYQIAKGDYDSAGNFLGYSMVDKAASGTWTINSDGSWTDPTEEQLAELFNLVVDDGFTGYATVSLGLSSATIENLPVGVYLIVVTGSESVAYNLMIGSVYYEVKDGEWAASSDEIDIASDQNLWAKSTTPKIEKTEIGGSQDGYGHGGSADLGDTLTYHITIDNIPKYDGEHPEFYVTDTLTGLTMTADELSNLKVTVDGSIVLQAGTDYTVTETDTGFKVDFVVNNNYTLNSYAGKTLVIEYQADITEAALDIEDHRNNAQLTYATTSYVTGSNSGEPYDPDDPSGGDTPGDTDHSYTFAMKMLKTGSDLDGAGLTGATFTLYTDASCSSEYQQKGTTVTATSDSDGYFTFSGLQEGTYYMKETTAPTGYTLNQTVYTVSITAQYTDDGTIQTWSITVIDENGQTVGTATNSATVTGGSISNTKLSSLPNTGGNGTAMFTAIGCILMLAAVGTVVMVRRKAGTNA